MSSANATILLLCLAAAFVAILLMLIGAVQLWNAYRSTGARRIARRLSALRQESAPQPADTSLLKKRMLSRHPALHELFLKTGWIVALDRLIVQSGGRYTVSRLLLISFVCMAATGLVLMLLPIPAAAAAFLACLAGALPALLVAAGRRKRLSRIEQQLPDALDLMGRALRAGHALPGAIRMAGEEMPEPIGTEFKTVFDEITYGVSLADALRALSSRVPGSDIGYFVVAVSIQRETGGNLTELLANISTIIRARLTLFGQVRVLSSEARLSGRILGLLPLAVAGAMQIVNPGFLSILWTDPTGKNLLGAVAVQMTLGALWMRKLVRIRV
jgi:tight adherence protein B